MYAPFSILTAFSGSFNGGNPAAVVFTDMNLPVDTFKTIAENLNQPITAFVSALPLPSNDSKSVTFDVRWFTSSRQEIALCGHGTLAAAKAVFDRDDVAEVMEVIKFQTLTRGIMQARRCRGGLFEIELPSASPVEVSPEERDRLLGLVTRTFGKEVAVDYIAYGGAGFELYLLFVLDEKEDLQNLPVNAAPLRESGCHTHVFTHKNSTGNTRFVSRMLAPGYVPGDEDHVCGSAHCLMAPYWYRKLGIESGYEISVRQVSRRGGDLKLVWDSSKNTLKLAGEVTVLGRGELSMP